MSFGKTIKLFRTTKRLTQVEIALILSISPEYLSKIENDAKQPSMILLNKISESFEIPLPVLLYSSLTERDFPKSKRSNFKATKPILEKLFKLLLSEDNDDFQEITILLKKLKVLRTKQQGSRLSNIAR